MSSLVTNSSKMSLWTNSSCSCQKNYQKTCKSFLVINSSKLSPPKFAKKLQKVAKTCKKVAKKVAKSSQKVVKKVAKNLKKSCRKSCKS